MKFLLKTCLILALVLTTTCCEKKNDENSNENLKSEVSVKRYGHVIKIKPEMIDKYKVLHANVWPKVKEKIYDVNIRNYSIYLKDDFLFSYFEYVGNDFEEDMAMMAKDSITLEWWKLTNPCQTPIESHAEGEWWSSMEEVFHQD